MQTGVKASKFELTSFQFANTLFNITSYNNKLYVGGVLAATSTAKFWFASDFITDLNNQLKTFYVTVSDVVTLDSNTNILSWVLPSGSISVSSMNRVLGILGAPSGTFTSTLFLVCPMYLAFMCPQLNVQSYNSFASTAPVCGVIPVLQGFMSMNCFEPKREWQLNFEPRITFNLMEVNIVDNSSGNLAEGMGEWSCCFVVK
jgi:hypothetical protein